MKKLILLILTTVAVCITCGDKSDPEPDVLEINLQSLSFPQGDSSQYVRLTSNTDWSASTNGALWLECDPPLGIKGSDVRVLIKASANNTSEVRTATVTFKTTGGTIATVKVLQAIADPFIVLQPASYEALAAGGDVTIAVTANYAWSVAIPENDRTWVSTKSKDETGVVFDIAANNTEADRSTAIVFSLDGKEVQAVLTLSQKKITATPVIEINPQIAEAPAAGGDVSTIVSSGVEWDVTIPSSCTWVSLKNKTSNQATFSVAENFTGAVRSVEISIGAVDGSAADTFTVNQAKDYTLTSTLTVSSSLEGKLWGDINTYVKSYGFDYTENPHCTGGYGGHNDGIHLAVEKDAELNIDVFRFDIHIDPVIDGDRCSTSTLDRQRNELKTATNNTTWAKVQGNYDEWQILEWKFKLPTGFQPTAQFCHIHQIKAQDGSNAGSPLITITPRANSNGTNKRMQLIHSVDGGTGTALGTFVDNIPLSDFEGEWVQVREEVHYTHQGYYSCKITRIRDGKVLINVERTNIDMWRKTSSYIRSKYGIYRSLAGGDLSKDPVGQSSLLKNESIWMCDFKVYEKNTNPNPGVAHD
ncbi:MAG: heparin lyase I family protein [Prevotella sp.]|jgi:hypothetical protein|nr:heparin lyase I family protein [Prevotella sp.]